MSIIKQVTLQKTVAHDFRYDPRSYTLFFNLGARLKWMANATHQVALIPENSVWTGRKISPALRFEARTVQPVDSRFTDNGITTNGTI